MQPVFGYFSNYKEFAMAALKEDIIKQGEWLVKPFEADGYKLDFSIGSLLEIDRFFEKHLTDGRPRRGGRLSKNYGAIIFSISSYIAQTLIKNVPGSVLITDERDPQGEINFAVEFPDGTRCWPAQKAIKRIQNGLEDGIYPYAFNLTEQFTGENFDESFWLMGKEKAVTHTKAWWKFW